MIPPLDSPEEEESSSPALRLKDCAPGGGGSTLEVNWWGFRATTLKRTSESLFKEGDGGPYLGSIVIKTEFPMQGTCVQLLVEELRAHMLCGAAER